MSRRVAVALAAVVAAALCGWAFAQPGKPARHRAGAAGGRFAVSSAGNSAILVDTTSGKTWVLRHSADGRRAAWLPVERIDDPEKARKWLEANEPSRAHEVLQARGHVVPVRSVVVAPRVGGRVVEVNVEEGSSVKRGDVLVRLESAGYRAKLDAATARLRDARAELDKLEGGATDPDLAVARAKVALAKAEVERAQWQLDATVLRAPLTGTVLKVNTEVGKVVSPPTARTPAGLCVVADLRELEVELAVPEKSAGKVAVGQACLVEVDAFPGRTFRGRVSRVRPAAGAGGRGFPVRVKLEFTDEAPRLLPGMTGGVNVVGKGK